MFSHKVIKIITHFFRYLNEKELNLVISNLLKFVFTKKKRINLNKKN